MLSIQCQLPDPIIFCFQEKHNTLTCQAAILQWSFLLTQLSVFHGSPQFDASYLSVPEHPKQQWQRLETISNYYILNILIYDYTIHAYIYMQTYILTVNVQTIQKCRVKNDKIQLHFSSINSLGYTLQIIPYALWCWLLLWIIFILHFLIDCYC